MIRQLLAIALASAVFHPSPALAWGKTGHRTTGAIADRHLSGLARAHVRQILGVESLDEAATWPDEMRSDPAVYWQKTSTPWHYVTVPGTTYVSAPPEGDARTALAHFTNVLRNPQSSRDDKALALRFIVHIVGDLHQPLHVGRPGDRGGNEIKLSWFKRPTNLHSVWDSAMIDDEQLSFTEWGDRLSRHISPEQVIAWWDHRPETWMTESATIRETIYPQGTEPELGYDYNYKHLPIVKRRLSQAGIRLAATLNHIFDSMPPARP